MIALGRVVMDIRIQQVLAVIGALCRWIGYQWLQQNANGYGTHSIEGYRITGSA